MTILDNIHI